MWHGDVNAQPLVIFGEVLFDCLPDGQQLLGGAPFNVAWHTQALGLNPKLVSAIGQDAMGEQVRHAMHEWGLAQTTVQTHDDLPTGRVNVSLDNGQPSYDIAHPVAYDRIDPVDVSEVNMDHMHHGHQGILYHGTLALRDAHSRHALERLKSSADLAIFVDVNLRAPWYDLALVRGWLKDADWAKLNDEEFAELAGDLDQLASDPASALEEFKQRFGLQRLIVTLGAKGALAMDETGQLHRVTPQPLPSDRIKDTIGAGDAFTSVVLLGLMHEWGWMETLQRAQNFASQIVTLDGALSSDPNFYQAWLKAL
ncbi:MAG: PfkB family carbohydrate kinase [Hydrogenovibrio sp.]|uniref:PfkB family carbohydrate kinase n=1 Tax=Hydrogenovibrio sp. TaxID=2065821 RepID=UPI0028707783|nr:PfkB family carbohydrate kinase [Hydrogenovibrio sp.]MDR9498185.1 PfkB family carbohydrate kinase [Hydrogenovibrio sp.]